MWSSFCQIHCPLGNIPDWLKLTAEGRLKEAYEVSQSTNMPEVCGIVLKIDYVKELCNRTIWPWNCNDRFYREIYNRYSLGQRMGKAF